MHAYHPEVLEAVTALGSQVGIARRELGWTAVELAERLGITPRLVTRIERGSPGTAIGTVFEAAVLCGVPLFGAEPGKLYEVAERERLRLAVLPSRVRMKPIELDDDF